MTTATVEDDGIVVRPAIEADGPALAEVELATPIVVGDERITYDRRADYFAYARLMEACDTVVAELDGRAIAVHAAAFHTVRVGGESHVVNYVHHLRTLPEAQGRKLLPRLKAVAVPRYPPDAAASYVWVDVRNRSINDRMVGMRGTHRWPVEPALLELDTVALATGHGEPVGTSATSADATYICELLEQTHGMKELWLGSSVASLTARLERDPSQYDWRDLRLGADAVVGLLRIGRTTQVIHQGPDGATDATRPAVVADLGGSVDGIVALLHSAAAELVDEGLDRVTVFASVGDALTEALRPFVVRQRQFAFWMTRLEPPPGVREIYVDPIYF